MRIAPICPVAALLLVITPVAAAHGPCPNCLKPDRAIPGAEVVIDYPTFKAVLNPNRKQLTPGPKPNCYGCGLRLWRDRKHGQPPIPLGRWRPRQRGASVRAPDIPPGRYLVALFDGSEGGSHYTWSYLTIEANGENRGDLPLNLAALAAMAIGAFGAAGWWAHRRG